MRMNTTSPLYRWLLFLAVAAALSTLVWAGWSISQHRSLIPGGGTIESDATVSVGLRTAPESLDIRTQEGEAVEQALLGNVMETLLTRNQDNTLAPGLAERWEVSEDGLRYTFFLHAGMHFSNGHALDADAVVWSLQQIVNKRYPGYDGLGDLASVQSDGTDTVSITLGTPNPQLLRALSGRAGIVYDAQADADYANRPIGSGPFTVSDFAKGSSVTLLRDNGYWNGKAKPAQVTLRYYGDDDSLLKALRSDEVQLALPMTASAATGLADDPSLRVDTGMGTAKTLLAFNDGTDSILSDERVRQATRYAIDTASLASSQPDAAQALGGPIGPLEPGYEDLTGLYPYDPVKARSLLYYFGAGYVGTAVLLVTNEYADLGNAIADQLRQNTTFTVDVQTVDEATLRERMANGDFTMALITMDGTTDAADFAQGTNAFHYQNGTVQGAWASALAATNDQDWQDRLKAYARTVSEDAASHWLYVRKDTIVSRKQLQGFATDMTALRLPLRDLSMG